MTIMMKIYSRYLLGASMALILSASGPFTALALPAPAPDAEFTEAYARLQDNQMDYDELEDLIKNYYEPIKKGYDAATNTYTKEMADISSTMFEAAREMEEAADDIEDAVKSGQVEAEKIQDEMEKVYTNRGYAKQYRRVAQSMGMSIGTSTRDDSKGMKSLQRQVNQIVYSLQLTMNGYEQLMVNRDAAAKGVEIAETAKSIQQTMQAQGLAVDADVISAAASLTSAKSQLEALDTQAASLKKTLCQFTGWGPEGDPVIGTVPSADVAAIASIDVNADKEKAVNNNYSLISLRGTQGGDMSQIEKVMTKSTTQARNKMRSVEYNEDSVRSNIQTLYDTILEKKVTFDSASTAWQAAQNTWQAAQIQHGNGSLSKIGFMQQEFQYLQARAAYRSADLNLQQAMQDYNWAVAGLTVDAE